jgi:DNA-binding IclR family transcriptional regulator
MAASSSAPDASKRLDRIDMAILAAIKAHPGQCIADIVRGSKLRHASQTYARIRHMAALGLVNRNCQKGRVLVDLTESGRKALAEVA